MFDPLKPTSTARMTAPSQPVYYHFGILVYWHILILCGNLMIFISNIQREREREMGVAGES